MPTKIERNRWLFFVSKFLNFQKKKCEPIKEIKFELLKQTVKAKKHVVASNIIKQEPQNDPNEQIRKTLNLDFVNLQFILHRKKIMEGSTRPIINLVDLKNMPDVESSQTFTTTKFNDEIGEERILCFLDESDDEGTTTNFNVIKRTN